MVLIGERVSVLCNTCICLYEPLHLSFFRLYNHDSFIKFIQFRSGLLDHMFEQQHWSFGPGGGRTRGLKLCRFAQERGRRGSSRGAQGSPISWVWDVPSHLVVSSISFYMDLFSQRRDAFGVFFFCSVRHGKTCEECSSPRLCEECSCMLWGPD